MELINKIERSQIRPGDHIYTYRAWKTYTHHGIYVGNNKVVHYTNMRKEYSGFISANSHGELSCAHCESDDKPNRPHCNVVGLICLDCFLQHGSLHRYRYGVTLSILRAKRAGTCTTAQSNSSERVVHCAYYLFQNGFGYYNVFRNNCEDFALYCKTELWLMEWDKVGRSGQVWTATRVPGVLMRLGIVMAVTLGTVFFPSTVFKNPLIEFKNKRSAMDIGVRKDVIPVAVEELPLNLGCGKMDANNKKKMWDLEEKIKARKKKMKRYMKWCWNLKNGLHKELKP